MSGKSRKAPALRQSATAQSQADNPAAAGLLPQPTSPSTSRVAPRIPLPLWIAGLFTLAVLLYIGILVVTPTWLPSWLRPVPIGPVPANVVTTTGNRISFVRSSADRKQRDLFVVNADG